MIYEGDYGHKFKFNDMVECTMTLLPREQTIGRLIQVRRGKGQFGSDQYLIRRADGTLAFFENVGLRPTDEVVAIDEDDATDVEYSFNGGKYPESGFIVENAKQPDAPPAAFGIAVSRG